MKLTVSTKLLAAALSKLGPLFGGRAAYAGAGMVKLHTYGENLILSANNLEIFMETGIEAQVLESGDCAVSGSRLLLAAKAMVGETVMLSTQGMSLRAESSQAERTVIGGMAVGELPASHHLDKVLATAEFKDAGKAFSRNLPFMCTEDAKYNLCGQLIDLEPGKINLISTDQKHMCVARFDGDVESKFSAIIPEDTCFLIASLEGDVMFALYGNSIIETMSYAELREYVRENDVPPARNGLVIPQPEFLENVKHEIRMREHNARIRFSGDKSHIVN